MRIQFYILALIAVTKAFAATPTPSCLDSRVDLRSVAVGYQCSTSTGAIFTRVLRTGFGESWQDPDGLIWGDISASPLAQAAASAECAKLGGILPSRDQFMRGSSEHFEEALPNLNEYSGRMELLTADHYSDGHLPFVVIYWLQARVVDSLANSDQVQFWFRCASTH